jgi:uncharacterized caspase-like protein
MFAAGSPTQHDRSTYRSIVLRALAFALSYVAIVGLARAESRVALVIGNGRYANAEPLPNAQNDATLIGQSLREVGFTVTEKHNVGLAELQHDIVQFAQAAGEADIALVYYAGHGIQVGGVNYLIPIDASLKHESSVGFETVNLRALANALASAKTRLIILDACRNNPFASHMELSTASRGISRGLARIETSAPGELFVFSTDPDTTAEDGSGSNSTFAAAVAAYIRQPGLEIHQVFNRVGQAVVKATNGDQVPWQHSSLQGDMFLNGSASQTTPSQSAEIALWQSAEGAGTPQAYRAYQRKYPHGEFAEMADIQLAVLTHPKPAVPKEGSPSVEIGAGPRNSQHPEPHETKVHSLSVIADTVLFGVMYPPAGATTIFMNGKDVSASLQSVQPHSVHTMYSLNGSPDQLNLRVGDNILSARFGDVTMPEYHFQLTNVQKQQAESTQANRAMSQSMQHARVLSVHVVSDSVIFVVLRPPADRPKIILNGKDVGKYVRSESRIEAGAFSTVTYTVGGSPKELNLRVGANVINIGYNANESVESNFIYTETQYNEASPLHRAPR